LTSFLIGRYGIDNMSSYVRYLKTGPARNNTIVDDFVKEQMSFLVLTVPRQTNELAKEKLAQELCVSFQMALSSMKEMLLSSEFKLTLY